MDDVAFARHLGEGIGRGVAAGIRLPPECGHRLVEGGRFLVRCQHLDRRYVAQFFAAAGNARHVVEGHDGERTYYSRVAIDEADADFEFCHLVAKLLTVGRDTEGTGDG